MVFSTLVFIYLFLPITLILYYIVPKKFRNTVLLFTSLFFYAWGEPKYVFIMILSILIDFCAGLAIEKFGTGTAKSKIVLIISVCMNITLLGIFKYSRFIADNVNALFGTSLNASNILLPIGISFFTFQSMSYTIDVYRGHIKVQKNLLNFATFVTMFPQIVAGPIVRYEDIQTEIDNRKLKLSDIYDGILIFIKGLGKKVLIANNIGTLFDAVNVLSSRDMSVASAWLGAIAFTLQIYFDFSGYSDMAIGLGKMLGFTFPANFDHPYTSQSVSEFWRRWHMTLGNWFKSYVYFPLGGSRKGEKRTIFNLAIVWLLTGIWHGANWTYILWGVYFGVFIIFEKVYFSRLLNRMNKILRKFYTLFVVILGWVLFSASSLTSAGTFLKSMFFDAAHIATLRDLYFIRNYGLIIAVGIIGSTTVPARLLAKFPKTAQIVKIAGSLAVLTISTAYLVNAGYNPFLYFNF